MENYRKDISASLIFRSASTEDVPQISNILKMAVARMLAEGKQQWDETYPNEIHVRADIEAGIGYVLESDNEIVGYAAVVFDGETSYNSLNGRWLSSGKYVVAHRMAIRQDKEGKGFGKAFMNTIEDYARSLGVNSFKIDTNFDNFSMLALLDKLGFTYCGDIVFQGGYRKAFEKLI